MEMDRLTIKQVEERYRDHDPHDEPRIIGTLCEQLLDIMRENQQLREKLEESGIEICAIPSKDSEHG